MCGPVSNNDRPKLLLYPVICFLAGEEHNPVLIRDATIIENYSSWLSLIYTIPLYSRLGKGYYHSSGNTSKRPSRPRGEPRLIRTAQKNRIPQRMSIDCLKAASGFSNSTNLISKTSLPRSIQLYFGLLASK